MNNKNFRLLACLLIILISSYCFSDDEIGIITYMEGEVTITRDEETLDNGEITVDMPIFNFDVIQTGENGLAEIDITTELGQQMSINVSEKTTFAIEIDKLEGKENTSFELFTGGLALKVNTLLADESVEVYTESANMGVRGTEFSVTGELTGDILITCDEGEVICTDDDGDEQIISPGYIIEKNSGSKMQKNQVKKEEMAAYRKEWRKKRIENFEKDGLPVFSRYAKSFNTLYTVLIDLAEELKKHDDIINRWEKLAKTNKKPLPKILKQDNITIEPIVVELKKITNLYERVVFQLLRMEPYHTKGHLKGEMSKGFDVKQFYADMNKKLKEINRLFGRARHVVKLFMKMNNGYFPKKNARMKFDSNLENYKPKFKD